MKSLSIVGIVLLLVSAVMFYILDGGWLDIKHIVGVIGGIGIGLIIGGLVGYVSKGSAMKAEQKRKELAQLKKEKEALEKQAAELANPNGDANI